MRTIMILWEPWPTVPRSVPDQYLGGGEGLAGNRLQGGVAVMLSSLAAACMTCDAMRRLRLTATGAAALVSVGRP
jgi:hypothetical protein